ncbi:unnamed protein product [Caenorhabditis nigoni]
MMKMRKSPIIVELTDEQAVKNSHRLFFLCCSKSDAWQKILWTPLRSRVDHHYPKNIEKLELSLDGIKRMPIRLEKDIKLPILPKN